MLISTNVKLLQLLNAFELIVWTLLGIVICVRPEFWNAFTPIVLTLSGILYDVSGDAIK